MNNYFYYAITIDREDLDERPITHRAIAIRVHQAYNLLHILESIKGIACVHQCKTVKEAERIANAWNTAYLNNGTYALSTNKTYPVYITDCN